MTDMERFIAAADALADAGKRLEAARDAMRRVYAALTTTQAHKISTQKELDEAWSEFDVAITAYRAARDAVTRGTLAELKGKGK